MANTGGHNCLRSCFAYRYRKWVGQDPDEAG